MSAMGWFSRMVERIEGVGGDDDDDDESQHLDINDDYVADDNYVPPSPLAHLMQQVMEYREQEIRDLRSETYIAKRGQEAAEKALGIATYERNEALGRIAKIYPILNQRQQKELQKPPVMLKFGPPPLHMHVWDESILDFRRMDVPPPATMKTVRRKGNQDKPVTVFRADKKSGGTE